MYTFLVNGINFYILSQGACKNCGAMGHKANECLERPRKKNAEKTGLDIAPDDTTMDMSAHGKITFDAKRDRWLGYHPDEHKQTIDRFNKIDQERRRARREAAERQEERRKAKEKLREIKKAAKAKAAATAAATADAAGGSAGGEASSNGKKSGGEWAYSHFKQHHFFFPFGGVKSGPHRV